MRFSTIVLKNIVRARMRSLLTVAGAAVAIGSLVALAGIATGLVRSTIEVYAQRNVDLIVIRKAADQGLNSALDESLTEKIRAIPGVREVTPGLVDSVRLEKQGRDAVFLMGWTFDSPPMREVKILAGRRLRPGDARQMMIGQVLADDLKLKVGDSLEAIEDEPFEIVGIFDSFSVYERKAMVVPMAELQRIMGLDGKVTGFSVGVQRPISDADFDSLRRQIEALGGDINAQTTKEFSQTNTQLQIARGMAWVTSLVALLIGAAGMANTMLTSVLERTREIGVLRAIGWKERRIALMILLESLVLSLSGAAIGSAVAVALVRLLVRLPLVNGFVDGRIGWGTVVLGVSVAVAFAILGAAYPARLGMRMLPANALRS